MGSFRRFAPRWIACLQLLLILGACSRAQPASDPAEGARLALAREAMWTNTFPPITYNGAALRFQHYGVEDGLSQSSAQAMLQDNQGFLWIGTQDGLNRFDGYSFKVYRSSPGDPQALSSGEILSMIQGADGGLWIGTNAGLNRYDPVTGQFRHWVHHDGNPDSIGNDTVQVVYQDPQRDLWVGTREGLDRFDVTAGKFMHIQMPDKQAGGKNADSVNALYMDEQHVLWIGTDDGLIRYDVAGQSFQRYRNDSTDTNSLSFDQVSSISEDGQGALWIGTHVGLDRLDRTTGKFTRFTHSDADPGSLSDNYVQVTCVDRAAELWVGTRAGLDRFNPAQQRFVHYQNDSTDPNSLSSNAITSIYEDRGGILWVGTQDAGLNEHDRSQDQFGYYHHINADPDALTGDVIFPIVPAPAGKMWIGTFGAGLNLFDPATGKSENFVHSPSDPESLLNDTVLSLFVDNTKSLWVGTHAGLDRLYPGSSNFFHYENDLTDPDSIPFGSVFAIYQDDQSTYWVGTAQGLRMFDAATGKFTKLDVSGADMSGLEDGPLMTIYQDRSGIMWFGTDAHGLFRFNPFTKQLQQYVNDPAQSNSLSSNAVLDVYEDSQGTIWVGTFGGGLDRYVPGQNDFVQYRQRDGLPNDVVYGILEDRNGNLWLSTNMGITKFNPSANTFENYTARDGLQSNEFDSSSFAEDAAGRMYFGGVKGLTVFDPARIEKNAYIPPLVLTSLRTQDGKPLAATQTPETLQQVTLSYPQNALDLSFAALSFSQTDKNQYKYKLEGFDQTWHSASTAHQASYTNLPGGRYVLHVLGSNNDGIWNESGTSIQITVVPPFWETWAFRSASGIFFLLAVVLLYRSRVRSIQAQKTALAQLVADRTQELRRQNVDLEALYSADEKMLRVLTQDEVLQALVDLAVDILEADKSAIFTQPAGQDKYCVRVWRGFRPETIQSSIFVHSQQEILATVAAGRRLILSDAVEDPTWRPPRSRIAELMDSQGFRSIMYMPIKVQDSVLGIFAVYCSTSPNTFDERRQRLFASLLQRAGLSIENSRLFQQTKHLAIVEERTRLAQDLHDSAKQKAFAALAQLGAAKKLANHDHGGAAEHLVEAENIVSDVIRDLTFFIQEFYPPNLKEKGLVAALQDYAFAWQARSGIQLNLSIVGGRSLPIQLEQVLYRIVQEGLSNIARHSQASVADLRIVYGEAEIRIDIHDNGIGFDLPATPHGLGLQLIHERLESIGGRVEIETHNGGGTSLTIELPISEPA